MADNVIGRTTIEIVGDTSRYNSSIDAAVQRTALMQARQRALTQELEQNQRKLDVSSRGLASNTSARERNAAAIQRAIAQYGQESTQVQRLLQTKASLERTTAQLTQRIEAFRSREQALNSQLTSVNQALAQQAANNGRITTSSNAASSSLSTMSQRLGSMMSMLKSMLAMRATRSFLEATIGGLSQFEQYETSFAVMLGNMQSAKDLMSDLQDFAAKTPYQLPDVTKAAQLLMNYGVEAKDLITTMTHLGDLSQGQADKLDRISLAYGQMLAKGKVTGEELRQMTEAGVPLTQALADNMGIATSELMGFIEKGQVGIPELDSAIEGLTTGTGKFAGMMEQQSQTLAGQWSTLKDNMGAFAREIGEEAFAETKSALAGISQEFAELKKSGELSALAKQWGAVFGGITKVVLGTTEALVKHKEMLGALVVAYGAWKVAQEINAAFMLKNKLVTEGATVAQAAFNATLSVNPLVLLAGALAVVVGGMLVFAQAADESTRKLRESQEQLQNLNDEVANIETSGIEDASSRLGELEMVSKQLVPEMQKIDETVEDVATRKKLLASRVEELNQVLGYEAASIDNITGHLKMNTDEIYKNVEALKAQAKAEATKAKMSDYYTQQIKAQEEIISDNEKIEELKVEREKLEQAKVDYLKKYSEVDPTADALTNQIDAIDSQIKNFTTDIKTQNDIIDAAGDGINKLSGMLDEYSAAAGEAQKATDDVNNGLMDTDALMESLEGSEKRLKTLASAQKEAADGGKLSISTIRALGESYSQLMPYLEDYMAGLIDEKELLTQFPALYQEESEQYSATMMQKYKDNEEFFTVLKKKNSDLFKGLEKEYRGDRGNWSTLAQAKGDIEQNLITQLSKKWQEYYSAVGGNAAKTVEAMEQQLAQLNREAAGPKRVVDPLAEFENAAQRKKLQDMINLMKPLTDLEGAFELNVKDTDFGAAEKKKKESAKKEKTWQEKLYAELKYQKEKGLIDERKYVDGLTKIRDSYRDNDIDNFQKYDLEIYKLQEQAKKNNIKILQEAFDDQLNIAKDFYDEQKKLVEEQSEVEINAINERYNDRLDTIKEEYEAEKDRVDGIISELQREIDAKKRARDEEKLNDDLSFAQTKIQNLQTQIQYARTPEEKAELEKELKRQQEELKDLTVQKEVNELEAEKRLHQERLSNLEEEYKEDERRLEKKRKKALAIAEEARDQALKLLEDSFRAFSADLHATYKFVNDETLSVGQRFAAATTTAIEAGFVKVSNEAQSAIDAMLVKVQDAISRLKSSVERTKSAYRSGTAVAYSSSDNRSMLVTNNISRGLTEGQVARLMDRQAERLLYRRR